MLRGVDSAEEEDRRAISLAGGPQVVPVTAHELSYASGFFLSSSGQRIRARRNNRSSRDESPNTTSDNHRIEEDLRVGVPSLFEPDYYRNLISPDHPLHTRNLDLALKALEICKENDLGMIDNVLFWKQRGLFEQDKPSVPTVKITVKRKPNDPGWAARATRAAWAVYHYLPELEGSATNEYNVAVEICDILFCAKNRLRMQSCTVEDAIFPQWEAVLEAILRTILLTGVLHISCCRAGATSSISGSAPTVLLGVDPTASVDWKDSASRPPLDLHGLPKSLTHGFKEDKPCEMGDSLASGHSPEAQGTLGCWVELQDPDTDEWMPYALTSARCVLPTDAHVESCAQKGENTPAFDEWKTYGVPFRDATAARLLLVDSPGLYEITMNMDNLDDLARDYEDEMRCERFQAAQAQNEPVSAPGDLKLWTYLNNTLTKIRAERAQIRKYQDNKNYEFGTVVAASGLKARQQEPSSSEVSSPSVFLDWALVGMRADRRLGENKSPCSSEDFLDPVSEVVGVWYLEKRLQPGQSLWTIGHSTAKTEGRYNGLRTAWITHTTASNSEARGEPLAHYVHSMYNSYNSYNGVMLWGDSGSMVFDRDGYVVGMCFEGNAHGDTAYFMRWEDLWEDILLKSGAKDIRFLGDEYSYRGIPLEMEWLSLRMISRVSE
ncbi:uncharacterized protein BO72DRAFT_489396 [Aspergillus fijiensis CBS 313.89]|uniref:Uncharacterized protein n=1 Tax=Aspergillus fijiensis CBS 313.89 TaxID=1448319 RepID=A0A8G1VXC7_9EURO|nr:uncharacterized protein BO72DRAFT_489396 [Aspergillus fijiensis CBS 313.89]RAK72859.1 hypothetical protein BO72DRAFT_489396 [Aspergillus fijiensis CBS 313.89]